jgi:hypothetical protein
MKKACCQNCAYAVTLRVAEQVLWVCTNALGMAGRLTPVEATGCCRQFRQKRRASVRPDPPESTDPSVRYIPLTKGLFAMVAAEDYERVSQYTWTALCSSKNAYACRNDRGKTVYLHQFLMNPPKGMVVDHIDGNGLNDRRSNLRVCTKQQNSFNCRPIIGSSRFKGVHFFKPAGKWRARIRLNGREMCIGYFDDEIEAAKAYDRKARELFGEYAYLNFPEEIGVAGRPATSDKKQVTSKK